MEIPPTVSGRSGSQMTAFSFYTPATLKCWQPDMLLPREDPSFVIIHRAYVGENLCS